MKTVLRVALTALAFASATAGAVPAAIRLRAHAAVGAGQVLLGDIARIHSTDLSTVKQLVDVPLAASPRPGGELVLRAAAVRRRVAEALGRAAPDFEWSGADAVVISGSWHEISAGLLEQTARTALQGWLAGGGLATRVELLQPARDLRVPAGQVDLKVRPIRLRAGTTRQLVWVDVSVNGRPEQAMAVGFDVPAATEASWLAAPTAGAEASPAAQPPKARGNFPRSQAIRRGEQVTVLLRDGGVQLEARAEAISDAQVGERVQVKVPGATSTIDTRVTGPGHVEAQR